MLFLWRYVLIKHITDIVHYNCELIYTKLLICNYLVSFFVQWYIKSCPPIIWSVTLAKWHTISSPQWMQFELNKKGIK